MPVIQRSLLAAPGPLELRVRGGEHDGRLIRIQSAKCTVGSASGCTLRLRAAGVAPLHCWILRGPRGAVIRRLHGGAALNGGRFDEASISAGDRLQIGAVSLEVTQCSGEMAGGAGSLAPTAAELSAGIDDRLQRALDEITRLEEESKQAWQSSITAAERADQLRDAVTAAQQELAEACGELASCRETIDQQAAQIERLREASAEAQSQLELAKRSSAMTVPLANINLDEQAAVETRAQQLETEIQELRQQLAQSQQTLAAAQREQAAAHERAEEHRAQLQRLERSLAHDRQELANLRADAEDRPLLLRQIEELMHERAQQAEAFAATQQKAEMLEQQLAEAQASAQSSSGSSAAAAEIDQLRGELAQRQAELSEQQAQLARDCAALENRRAELDQQCAALAAEREALAAQRESLSAELESISAERASLQRDREFLAAERAQLLARQDELTTQYEQASAEEARLTALKAQLDSHQANLEARQGAIARSEEDLSSQKEILELERRALTMEREQRAAAKATPASQAVSEHFAESEPQQLAPSQAPEAAFEPMERCQTVILGNDASGASPADQMADPQEPSLDLTRSSSVNSVLSRLVQAGVWRKPEDMPADAEPAAVQYEPEPTPVRDEPAQDELEQARFEEPIANSHQPSATTASSEEDSIEDYMARLLKRVRGESTTNAGGWKQQSAPASEADAPTPEATPTPEPAPVVDAVAPLAQDEFVPRSKAPELTTDLTAMRALANSAARTAIDQHIRKHSGRQAVAKLAGAGVTVCVSAVLGYWAWRTGSLRAGLGALLGAAVGTYWLIMAIKRFLTVLRLNRPEPAATNPPVMTP